MSFPFLSVTVPRSGDASKLPRQSLDKGVDIWGSHRLIDDLIIHINRYKPIQLYATRRVSGIIYLRNY